MPTTMPAEAHPPMRVAGDSSPAPLPADVAAEPEPPERLSVTLVEEDGDWSGFGALEEAVAAGRRCARPASAGADRARQRGERRARQRCAGAPPQPHLSRQGRGHQRAVVPVPAAARSGARGRRLSGRRGAGGRDGAAGGATSAGSSPGTISSISSCTACCICWATTTRPTPRRTRWSAWRPRSWRRSALPTHMPPPRCHEAF